MADENQLENISLTDLGLVIQIIDACTKRGAFRGEELFAVGQLRNKVEAFLKVNLPQEENTAE